MPVYKKHFGFKENPFSIAPNPRYLYLSTNHQDALAHLLYGAQGGGFVLLSGEVGTGKTTLCRYLLGRMPKDTHVALVLNPMLSTNELLATICDELKIPYPKSCADKVLIDAINRYLLKAYADGKNVLLIVDEAQNLSFSVLEQLRLLTNLETDDKKLLQIILVGQPELLEKISHKRLRQLAQRITARYHLSTLSRIEMNRYIQHRVSACGVKTPLFTATALRILYWRTKGIPRLINIVCDRALLGAYSANEYLVGARHVLNSAREVISTPKQYDLAMPAWLKTYFPAAALITLLIGGMYWSGGSLRLDFNLGGVSPAETKSVVARNQNARSNTDTNNQSEALSANDDTPKRPLPVAIASGSGPDNSTDNAIVILFNRWNLNYLPTQDGDFCLYAVRQRLQCLKGRASLDTLLNYNRPSMLHGVQGDDGRYHDVVLVGIEDNMLQITVGTTVQAVPQDTFTNYWNGRFTLLWKPPDAYSLPLRQGDSGPLVSWLANRRAQLAGGAVLASWTLDGELLAWLIDFQKQNNLPANGVINPETVIMIANLSNTNVPRLKII